MKIEKRFFEKWNDSFTEYLEDKITELELKNNIYVYNYITDKYKKVDIIYVDNLEDITIFIYKKSIVIQAYNKDLKEYGRLKIK